MISVVGVSKSLGANKILDDVNLFAKEGAIYGLLGPNGAGKTTLIKNMVGIYTPDEGEIFIDGQKLTDGSSMKGKIAYIPDFQNFYNQFKVGEMVDFYRHTYRDWNEERYKKLKELFSIQDHKKIRQLSKGMKTQLAIHLNLSMMPKVMVMDEPTSGLDPVIRREVLNLIVQEVSLNNTTVLISTHNLGELEQICDHIGMMNKGKILLQTNIDDLKEKVRKIQVAFKGEIPKEIQEHKDLLKIENVGKVYQMVVKEGVEKVMEEIKKHDPILLETIDMSLEEIFIYKMGGEGYEFCDFTF
ncbi:ABC transporter ATP-binding protein [Inediibacterium massiliense]|uniref:ABC transporter ATP-binding protein n=1 Tax=Inediibacterium massiliense TaxID=1658111 RepID=UPI0006B69B44|nr:ABC transporter ATP-binding protein [Inediibacterium massiliense]